MLRSRCIPTLGDLMLSLRHIQSSNLPLPENRPISWVSHMMAPAPRIMPNGKVAELFVGGWNREGISSIYSVEIDLKDNCYLDESLKLRLSPGKPGTFDENGVFPASVIENESKWMLSYTGFQLGMQIPHYNFGGLAKCKNEFGTLQRISEAPIIDRADEGLTVRAGLTAIKRKNKSNQWISAYAAGSTFELINGKLRPNYSVYIQHTNPEALHKSGELAIPYLENEHGVGRPYLIEYKGKILLFYTRRMRDFSYLPGLAVSKDDGFTFERMDYLLEDVSERLLGVDDEMQYFPAPAIHDDHLYVFYNGNNFGKYGIGIWEFLLK